ncbi:exodeoxyribonuclease 1 [Moniliophthora roreri]|nr:exodeoxyribonuclease 1 [Moniliophthora roreri]
MLASRNRRCTRWLLRSRQLTGDKDLRKKTDEPCPVPEESYDHTLRHPAATAAFLRASDLSSFSSSDSSKSSSLSTTAIEAVRSRSTSASWSGVRGEGVGDEVVSSPEPSISLLTSSPNESFILNVPNVPDRSISGVDSTSTLPLDLPVGGMA